MLSAFLTVLTGIFYLEAGRRWWQVLILTTPMQGPVPRAFIAGAIALWLPIAIAAFFMANAGKGAQ